MAPFRDSSVMGQWPEVCLVTPAVHYAFRHSAATLQCLSTHPSAMATPSAPVYTTFQHHVSWEELHGYVQVVRVGNTAYFSGQFAHDGESLVGGGDFKAQCEATFANLDKCLKAVGATRQQVTHVEVLVVDVPKHLEILSAAQRGYFGTHRPACTLWGVTALGQPEHMLVEIKLTVSLDLVPDHKTITYGLPWEEENAFGQVIMNGSTALVSGQFSHDENGQPVGGEDFALQCEQAFRNVDSCLGMMKATREQIVHTEVLILNPRENMSAVSAAHKKFFGSYRPASTVWGVTALGQPQMQVEIKFTVRFDLPKTPKTFSYNLPWENEHNYNQVVVAGETAWISGQLAHDLEGKPVGEGDFEVQVAAAFENLDRCLAAIGATRSQIVHAGSMVVNLEKNGDKLSAAHKKYFGARPPVSTVWGVTGLGMPYMLVEINAIVRLDAPKHP